jgi:hypothetical protein
VRGIARVKEFLRAHEHLQTISLYVFYCDMSIRINTICRWDFRDMRARGRRGE